MPKNGCGPNLELRGLGGRRKRKGVEVGERAELKGHLEEGIGGAEAGCEWREMCEMN